MNLFWADRLLLGMQAYKKNDVQHLSSHGCKRQIQSCAVNAASKKTQDCHYNFQSRPQTGLKNFPIDNSLLILLNMVLNASQKENCDDISHPIVFL